MRFWGRPEQPLWQFAKLALPHSGFQWLSKSDIDYFCDARHILALEDYADYGSI